MDNFTATFLLGLPDSQNIKAAGISKDGSLVYQVEGNAEFHNHLRIPENNKNNFLILWFNKTKDIPNANIIINCITDPDTNMKSLIIANNITSFIKQNHKHIALFNDPEKVLATTRDKIYQLYNNLPEVYVPKVIRITPLSSQDVFKMADLNNMPYPFLIRTCGSHESQNLTLISGIKDAELLEKYPFDGREFYLTEFVDYRYNNGIYNKARLLMIGDVVCPRHYMAGEGWMVYGNLHAEYMAKNKKLIEAENYFINNFEKMISENALKSLKQIYKLSGLDYLGFDFAIKPDGSVVIFEINPAQNPFISLNPEIFPYMPSVRENIISAFNNHVRNLVSKH